MLDAVFIESRANILEELSAIESRSDVLKIEIACLEKVLFRSLPMSAKKDIMMQLHKIGNSKAAIGRLFGVTRQNVHQIIGKTNV